MSRWIAGGGAASPHAPSHATGGGDPVTPDSIGAYRAEYGNTLNGYIDDALGRILSLETRVTNLENP